MAGRGRQMNELSPKETFRLFSEYHDRSKAKFWIVTDGDRSATTMLDGPCERSETRQLCSQKALIASSEFRVQHERRVRWCSKRLCGCFHKILPTFQRSVVLKGATTGATQK